jgi:glutathione S-transferase
MLTLYQAEWCPYCHRVRQVMTELGLTYTNVNVEVSREDRTGVIELSGQALIPVLQDEDTVIAGSDEIIAYLRQRFPGPADSAAHAEIGRYRVVLESDEPPEELLERLRDVFAEHEIRILSEVRDEELGTHAMPEGYVLLQAGMPHASEQAVQVDPTVPAAVTFPLAVFAANGGSALAVTRPFAEAWVYGEPELSKLTMAVTQRVYKALEEL